MKLNRKFKHRRYVEKRVTQLRREICMDAIYNGYVDDLKREWLLKYNEHLKHI